HAFAELLTNPDPTAFYDRYPYAVAPPTDDHPFFFHFFKWQQIPEIVQTLGTTWQPFGGSGYLVLVILLLIVIGLSAALILVPLFWLNDQGRAAAVAGDQRTSSPRLRYLLYFTLLGVGFLFVEIPLLQQFILFLGQPTYAFTVVVAALLVAAGVGSHTLSPRLSLRVVLPLITLFVIAYPFLLPPLFDATLRLPFAGRVVVTGLALFPVGALLGVPFPREVALIGETAPGLVPWVWAVNGCASVVSAVLAAMVSLTWGFSVVLWSGALMYGLAGLTIWTIRHSRVKGTNLTPPQL
ncbi:MAG: hypothetical protein R3264_15075, partial [Anaerolineae bacterium]|nr:hypothetical protein [Anaerolineae bacterium]